MRSGSQFSTDCGSELELGHFPKIDAAADVFPAPQIIVETIETNLTTLQRIAAKKQIEWRFFGTYDITNRKGGLAEIANLFATHPAKRQSVNRLQPDAAARAVRIQAKQKGHEWLQCPEIR